MKKLLIFIVLFLSLNNTAFADVYLVGNDVYASLNCIKIIDNLNGRAYTLNELSSSDQDFILNLKHKTINNERCIDINEAQRVLKKKSCSISLTSYNFKDPVNLFTNDRRNSNDKTVFTRFVDVLDNTQNVLVKIVSILGIY